MDRNEESLNHFKSFGYSFCKKNNYSTKGIHYWHPGYAWAITRKAYEKIGGLYDKGVLGSGDNIMALSFINNVDRIMNISYSNDYNHSMTLFQTNAKHLRLGYTPGVIRHHYHGTKENRRYTERWKILMNHKYSPYEHLQYNEDGLLVPRASFSEGLKLDIMNYFQERKEDD
jgi:hypothetical protein